MKKNSLIPEIKYLESQVRKLKSENSLLKERLRTGYREPKFSAAREKVRKYKDANPDATIREIQKACQLSSPSVVAFHLNKIKLGDLINHSPIKNDT